MRYLATLWPSLALLAVTANAQEPSLADAVDQYLGVADEAQATRLLTALLARTDATASALHAAITARPPMPPGELRFTVPYAGNAIVVVVDAPPPRRSGQLLPVLLAINWSSPPLHEAVKARVITAQMPDYTPPQFSDEGRDVHSKVLRAVAHRAGGDADALWYTGFSWGGHACWDDALHRPGVLRGFIGRGGGPRRTIYRLLPNLAGMRTLAVCGGKDDAELVWNLRELQRTAKGLGLDHQYWEPADSGHDQPLPGEHEAGLAMLATAAVATPPLRGTVLADGPSVEHPLFRFDEVFARACAIPAQIPVSTRLSADEQRRATIAAMAGAVAQLRWEIQPKGGIKTITLHGKAVRRGTLFLREPWFSLGDQVRVVVRGKELFRGELLADSRQLLEEARRTGELLRPALRRFEVRF